jgi:hypothetical protein
MTNYEGCAGEGCIDGEVGPSIHGVVTG